MDPVIVDVTEQKRLNEAREAGIPWKKWGPYLSERQWGTVREDYSEGGDAWNYFTHDQARSRAYRWGEDGLGGLCDDKQRLCFADTLQLNYGNPATQEAMIGELERIAGQCDGVRCDMAMLVLPDVFESTWGIGAELFWPKATESVRRKHPNFRFMAEVYWDMEWTLQQQGFDYAYDKRLYDRLREGHARPVREHFHAGFDYQNKLARFLENHDEPRAAATFLT